MARFAAMIVALVACSAFADARLLLQKASGNNNANGAQRTWAVEGGRNMYASLGTSDAIAAAAASGKAYFASAFGSKASKATTLRSAQNSAFSSTGARHLLQKASGNNGANNAQRTWQVEGGRNMYASLGTSDAIAAAAATGKAYFASAFGSKASKATTLRSAQNSAFTANGARHLLGDRTDRADRNSIAIQATADRIQSALGADAKSTKAATKAGLSYSKLATSNSVRASDFTGARHLLGDRTDRADRNSIAIQATADRIQSALGADAKSTKAATKAGLSYSKLASDFTGAK